MKTISIKAQKRDNLGKKATQDLRDQELVPCVMYGGDENIHFAINEKELNKLVFTSNVFLITLDIDGKKVEGIMQNIQFHPVSDTVLHVDFIQAFGDRPISVSLPLTVSGDSKGLKLGGKLRIIKRYLKVRGLSKDLPDVLNVDITKLNINQSIRVEQLSYKNLTLLDSQKSMVLSIVSSRLAKQAGASDEEAEVETVEPTTEEASVE